MVITRNSSFFKRIPYNSSSINISDDERDDTISDIDILSDNVSNDISEPCNSQNPTVKRYPSRVKMKPRWMNDYTCVINV